MILIIKHAKIEGPGTLGDFFRETSWKTGVVELWKTQALPRVDDCEAIISLGGPMNVYETKKYPFLEKEESFLKKALKENIPVLGICLGAQLLAKAASAKVEKAENKEIGWYTVGLTKAGGDDLLFKRTGKDLKVFQWHEDSFNVPESGNLLATAATCRNQAIRVGKNAWGLQFHPEMTEGMLEAWLSDTEEALDEKEIMLNYFKVKQIYDRQAQMMYLNFATAIARKEN